MLYGFDLAERQRCCSSGALTINYAAGMTLAGVAGCDGIRDTWGPYGNADMLERAARGDALSPAALDGGIEAINRAADAAVSRVAV